MSDFLANAWILLGQFKNDNTRNRSSSGTAPNNSPSPSSARRSSFNPNQARGGDGRWTETNAETRSRSGEGGLFDPNSAIGRAYAKQEQEKAAIEKPKPTLKDVEVTDLGSGGVQYTHVTKEKNKLDVFMLPTSDKTSRTVSFEVNESLDKAENLSSAENNRISIKIAKILQFDASTRQDGDRYQATAHDDDSEEYGAVRAYAYERIANFSRPVTGEVGNNQYGIIKNGKIIPDTERLKAEDAEWRYTEQMAEETANEYRRVAENYRKSQKT